MSSFVELEKIYCFVQKITLGKLDSRNLIKFCAKRYERKIIQSTSKRINGQMK